MRSGSAEVNSHPHARGILAKRFRRILQKHPHPCARGGTFGEFCKSPLWYPAPTRVRRHPAFAEFCKACTRPLLRENGRKDPHSSPQPADLLPPYVSAPPRHQLCGFWTVVQITHTRTREEALLQNSAKVHFGTPHLHA